MKISIITPTFNSEKFVSDCLISVKNQTYSNIEHIIIDGKSIDNTITLIKSINSEIILISEPDNGLYDAINKGIKISTGDYVGILNSDDFYKSENSIQLVVEKLIEKETDCLIADLEIVDTINTNKIIRKYKSDKFNKNWFSYGMMPPHPTFFCKRNLFDKFGFYKLDYKIAADFELMVRFLKIQKITYTYLNKYIVTMRNGGVSNQGFFKSKNNITKEVAKALKENNLPVNMLKLNARYIYKLFQLFNL